MSWRSREGPAIHVGAMHRKISFLVGLVLSIAVSGCATITSGGFQTIDIRTEPEGADCRFSRDGNAVARVSPTPGPILVGKSAGSISVLCRKNGYEDTTGTIGSGFQPMTLGNILLGGIIGVVVDASTGAMTKYPDAVTFLLIPHEFRSESDRDSFFADLGQSFLSGYDEVVGRIRKSCMPEDCERQLQAAEAGRQAKMAEIEQRRLLAKVGGTQGVPVTVESASPTQGEDK